VSGWLTLSSSSAASQDFVPHEEPRQRRKYYSTAEEAMAAGDPMEIDGGPEEPEKPEKPEKLDVELLAVASRLHAHARHLSFQAATLHVQYASPSGSMRAVLAGQQGAVSALQRFRTVPSSAVDKNLCDGCAACTMVIHVPPSPGRPDPRLVAVLGNIVERERQELCARHPGVIFTMRLTDSL
jgi:hypothetical protein